MLRLNHSTGKHPFVHLYAAILKVTITPWRESNQINFYPPKHIHRRGIVLAVYTFNF